MQLSDKISMLTDRLDDFTCRIDEINTKLTDKRHPVNFLNIGRISNSLSSSQLLAKDLQLIDEVFFTIYDDHLLYFFPFWTK